jgi:hypothetical protein
MGRPVEPEVVADAVFRVAQRSSREYWLGVQTLLTILGNTVAPALFDRYLARKAVAGQQTTTPAAPGREDNLEHPVTALHRTRGSFTAESSSNAVLLQGDMARAATVVFGAIVFVLLGAILAGQRSRRR